MEVPAAVKCVTEAMKADTDYRYSWQANIAMAFKDEVYRYQLRTKKKYLSAKDYHVIANEAADNFLNLLSK